MTKTNISQKALTTIQQQKIKPTPRWHFLGKNILFWTLFLLSLLAFALGVSVSAYMIQNPEYTPYFWFLVVFVFIFAAFILFRHTKKSYRFHPLQVIFYTLLIGLSISLIFHQINAAPTTDNYLAHRFKIYRSLAPLKQQVWSNPSQGYLSGQIIKIVSSGQFILQDFNGKIWTVQSDQPLIRRGLNLAVGLQIKLIGQQLSPDSFAVTEIRPWGR